MSDRPATLNLFFRLTTLCAAIFVITIFALVATIFNEGDAPSVRFLNEHGGTLLIYEVIAIVVVGVLAMAVDRLQILRSRAKQRTAEIDLQFADSRDDD